MTTTRRAVMVGSALLLAACGSDGPSSQDGALTAAFPSSTGVTSTQCESLPMEQVHVLGTTYWRSFTDEPRPEDLGEVVGTITRGLPPEATTCGKFTLVDGQGTPPNGTAVYSIKGIAEEAAVATFVDGEMKRFNNADLFGQSAAR